MQQVEEECGEYGEPDREWLPVATALLEETDATIADLRKQVATLEAEQALDGVLIHDLRTELEAQLAATPDLGEVRWVVEYAYGASDRNAIRNACLRILDSLTALATVRASQENP
jgi:hypothetical protein